MTGAPLLLGAYSRRVPWEGPVPGRPGVESPVFTIDPLDFKERRVVRSSVMLLMEGRRCTGFCETVGNR